MGLCGPEFDSRVQHRARHDLGLALEVQALGAQLGKDPVDPLRRELPEPDLAERGYEKPAQNALVLGDRRAVERCFSSQVP